MSDNRKITVSQAQKEYWHKLVPEKVKPFIETNALIADFMGYNVDDTNNFFNGIHYYRMTTDNILFYDQLTIDNVRSCTEGLVWHYTTAWEKRYDTCWNHLMEVIEKINKTFFDYNGSGMKSRCTFCINDDWAQILTPNKQAVIYNRAGDDGKLIDVAYKTVIQFIKLYNEKNIKD